MGNRTGRIFRDQVSGMASLFDLYGLILTAIGVSASDEARAKAAGINIDLWAGLVLLAGGRSFSSGPGSAPAGQRPLRSLRCRLDGGGDDGRAGAGWQFR